VAKKSDNRKEYVGLIYYKLNMVRKSSRATRKMMALFNFIINFN